MSDTPAQPQAGAAAVSTVGEGNAAPQPVGKLVVDTNALIRRVRMDELAEQLYTVPEVLAEIRDSQTKDLVEHMMLQQMTVKEPSHEARLQVNAQARKSGDLSSLSHCDLQVMALTWQLHCEANGISMTPPASAQETGEIPGGKETRVVFQPGPLGIVFAPWPLIASISAGTQAAAQSELRPGMALTAVGGTSVIGMDKEKAEAVFKSTPRPAEFSFWTPTSTPPAKAPESAFSTGAWGGARAAEKESVLIAPPMQAPAQRDLSAAEKLIEGLSSGATTLKGLQQMLGNDATSSGHHGQHDFDDAGADEGADMFADADESSSEEEQQVEVADFVPSSTFADARPGYAFRSGSKGTGYYREDSEAAAEPAPEQEHSDGLASAASQAFPTLPAPSEQCEPLPVKHPVAWKPAESEPFPHREFVPTDDSALHPSTLGEEDPFTEAATQPLPEGWVAGSDEDDDNDGEWITMQNIQEVRRRQKNKNCEPAGKGGPVAAACITADFAMQNVMLRMGLKVMSMNGMMVKKTKQFVKKCHACFKVIYTLDSEFCPRCGSDFVVKVSMTVDKKGRVFFSKGAKSASSLRGTKYSIAAAKRGVAGSRRVDEKRVMREDELPVGRSRSQKDGSLTIFEARPRGWGEFSGPSRIVIRNGGKNPNEQNSYKRESGRKKS